MARIRTIKPEFWQNEELAEVTETARLVAIGLLNLSDDEGWFKSHVRLVGSALFPFSEPSVSIHECLTQLSNIGYITIHNGIDGKQYGNVVNFLEHQRVNRPSPSKIKPLVEFSEDSVSIHGGLTAGKERKGKERKGTGNREQGKETPSDSPPTWLDSCVNSFWESYPKKVDKKQAHARLEKMIKKNPNRQHFEMIISRVKEKAIVTEKQFFPSPDRYLKDELWNDEIIPSGNPQNARSDRIASDLAEMERTMGGTTIEHEPTEGIGHE